MTKSTTPFQGKYLVASNTKLCPSYYRLCLEAPALAPKIRPGQFIHIRVHDGLEPLFRRPFSVFRAQKHVEIFYEVVGQGTALLADKKRGDLVDVLGPLGEPFSLPSQGVQHAVMIAGGIGVAPFMILSDFLKKNKGLGLTLLYGARSKDQTFAMQEFRKNGCQIHITTEDGSVGTKGRVSKLFSRIATDPRSTMIYACGPRPMLAAVQAFAKEAGVRGEVSCEEVMACGLGACLGCSIPTRQGYKTVCYDGPVFDLHDIIFEKPNEEKP